MLPKSRPLCDTTRYLYSITLEFRMAADGHEREGNSREPRSDSRLARVSCLLISVILVVVFVETGFAAGALIGPVATTDSQATANASIELENQTTNGSTIVVRSVTVPEGGFVVLHGSDYLQGYGVADSVAVSEYIKAGTHENVTLTVSTQVPGTVDDYTRLNVSDRVAATVHRDSNDNHQLDYYRAEGSVDHPYGGVRHPVEDTAFVTVEGSRADADGHTDAERVAIHFPDQMAANRTVTVDSITLPRGGYVSIHTAAYLPPRNESIESTIGVSKRLAPGTHRNVTIPMDGASGTEQNQTRLQGRQLLVAVPRYDTGQSGTFEFVATEGREDPSYVDANGTLVTAQATVETRHSRTDAESSVKTRTRSKPTAITVANEQGERASSEDTTASEPVSTQQSNETAIDTGTSGPLAFLPNPLYLAAIGLLAVMVLFLARIES